MKSFSKFLAEAVPIQAIENSFVYFIVYNSIQNPRDKNLYIGMRYGSKQIGEVSLWGGLRSNFGQQKYYFMSGSSERIWKSHQLTKELAQSSNEEIDLKNNNALLSQKDTKNNFYLTSSANDHPESLINTFKKGYENIFSSRNLFHPQVMTFGNDSSIYNNIRKKGANKIWTIPTNYPRPDQQNATTYAYMIYSAQNSKQLFEILETLLDDPFIEFDKAGTKNRLSHIKNIIKKDPKNGLFREIEPTVRIASDVLFDAICDYHEKEDIHAPTEALHNFGFNFNKKDSEHWVKSKIKGIKKDHEIDDVDYENTRENERNAKNVFAEDVVKRIKKELNSKGQIGFLEAYLINSLNLDTQKENAPPMRLINSSKSGIQFFEHIFLPKEFDSEYEEFLDPDYRSNLIDYLINRSGDENLNSMIQKRLDGLKEETLLEFSGNEKLKKAEMIYLKTLKNKNVNNSNVKTSLDGFRFAIALLSEKIKFKNIFLERNGNPEVKITLDQFRNMVFKSKRRK